MTTTRSRAAALFAFTSAAFALAIIVAAGAHRPGYSHVTQFMSELGERGARDGSLVSLGGFLPTGLLVVGFLLLVLPAFQGSRRAAIGAVCICGGIATGYIVSAFAPCDPGCPEMGGSATQTVHTLAGVVQYSLAFVGLILFGLAMRTDAAWNMVATYALVAAPILAVLSGALLAGPFEDWWGLLQRIAEAILFGWVVLVGITLTRPSVPPSSV